MGTVFRSQMSGWRAFPSGNWMVAWGTEEGGESGARLYQSGSGTILQTLTDLPVRGVVWQPDSMAFYLTTEDSIYRVAFPQLSLQFVADGYDRRIYL